ncbi:MAG: peptide deformylase [Gammaproteobacteria bacterium]|nr:MAG: peptide deformylase [Gammaproteobacteria bacterium]
MSDIALELIPDEDRRLHTKAKMFNPRQWHELDATVEAMFKLMNEHDGIGLAAPQVGIMKRLFIMHVGFRKYVCINPRITRFGKERKLKDEGCLSYPEQDFMVERSLEIRVSYQDAKGTNVSKKYSGLLARCFQHELDHLNGITFLDVGTLVDA